MSTYATIVGHYVYQNKADYDNAIKMLTDDGWLRDRHITDECDDNISADDDPDTDDQAMEIRIPLALHRNLNRALDELFKGATGEVVWASTDGMFDGGVITDGKEKAYDLAEWAKTEKMDPAPDPDSDFQGYCDWQGQVEEAFFEQFT